MPPELDDHARRELLAGAQTLGLGLDPTLAERLLAHGELLLKWNKSINLTATTAPLEVVEKHLLDSLCVAPHLPAGLLLDAGSGGGFPGIPVALARPDVDVTLVDSVQKKVAFLKSAIAALKLPNARALAVRLAGKPDQEGLPLVDVAVARAFAAPDDWLKLALPYLKPQGRVVVLLGAQDRAPDRSGELAIVGEFTFTLPFSGSRRTLLLYGRST
ncbi:MAG: 16S rRNA (guanine(527)-N(7))-methyltransferase RsmG [Deltaproteobacteria bacterium]|nr:16S rRNA (guanine(527)-N(7))-methyltransferase RsmG [Deltaproteobacteria bacterium]